MLETLRQAVATHAGEFLCRSRRSGKERKVVPFKHLYSEPDNTDVPNLPGLREFFQTFGSVTLYADDESGDAAYHVAPPSHWRELDECFRPWLDGVEDDEGEEFLPSWINTCLVVGEIPRSGNYLLIPTLGDEAGTVYEFDHDGCEFSQLGANLPDFVTRSLDLDSSQLTKIASHMCFVADDPMDQWWILELKDNRGNVVATEG
jgi:hypothetical protein